MLYLLLGDCCMCCTFCTSFWVIVACVACVVHADETVADEYAALLVQAEWRGFTLRRRRIVDIFQGSERQLLVCAMGLQ